MKKFSSDGTDRKKMLKAVIISAMSMFLFIIFTCGSLNIVIYDKDFYYQQYEKNNVYPQLSLDVNTSKQIATNVTNNVIAYFHHKEELRYFNDKEASHMSDVRGVLDSFSYVYYASVICLIILFFYLYHRSKDDRTEFIDIITQSMIYSSIACITLFVMLFLLCMFYFNQTFTIFHLIFFPQGNWQFPGGLMITMFTESFFSNAFIRIFEYAMFQSIIFLGIGYWLNKQLRNYKK